MTSDHKHSTELTANITMGFSLLRSLYVYSFLASLLSTRTCTVQAAAAPWFENTDGIEVIPTLTDFQNLQDSHGVWMVHFTDGSVDSKNKELTESYKALGQIMRGIFNVAVVDVSTDAGQEIAESAMPKASKSASGASGKIIMLGDDKKKPVLYKGGSDYKTLAEELVKVASTVFQERALRVMGNAAPGAKNGSGSSNNNNNKGPSRVVQLTKANFEAKVLKNPAVVVVAFAAPWCGHCKNLEPEWEQAAKQLYGKGAVLGWVDATVEKELGAIYGVKGYPTIKVFPGGQQSSSDAVDYQGERKAGSIVMNVLKEVDRSGVPKPVDELTSMTVLQDECSGANHICVLAALPHIMDSGAAGRNKYRELLAAVSKNFRELSFTFLWFEGTSQPALGEALELTFGFPAIVAFSMDREAYSVLRGSFSEKGITSFLHGVMTGRQEMIQLSQLPTVVTVAPWDGQDAPIQDEISLSGIMGWGDD
jgi:protein disulfide-isomerase A6